MERSTSALRSLNNKLNKFVVGMAVQQPELVDINFLIKYIEKFTLFTDKSFFVDLNTRKQVFEMIEDKLQEPQITEMSFPDVVKVKLLTLARFFGS